MTQLRSIKHHFLIVGLLALFLGWALLKIFTDESKKQQQYYDHIVDHVHEQVEEMDRQLDLVIQGIQGKEAFSEFLLDDIEYPYFLFRGDSLYFWSNFHYVPQFFSLVPDGKHHFISDRGVESITKGQILEDGHTIFMILPVHKSRNIQNNYIQAEFNSDIFPPGHTAVQINVTGENYPVNTPQGDYLFSLELGDQAHTHYIPVYYGSLALNIIAVISLFCYIFYLTVRLVKQNQFVRAFLVFVGGLLLIRGGMLYFDFPGTTLHIGIFDPQLYASSDLNHSLGDLFLNELILLAIVAFVFKYYRYMRPNSAHEENRGNLNRIILVTWLLLGLLFLYFQYHIIALFYQSQWSLDIASILDFSFSKFLSLVVIVVNAIIYFMVTHLAFTEARRLLDRDLKALSVHYLIAVLAFLLIAVWSGWNWPVVILLNSIYLGLLYLLNISQHLGQFSYTSFLYLFVGCLQCAIIVSYAVNNYEKIEDASGKLQLADQLLNERDVVSEFLLAEAMGKIQNDPYIVNQMLFSPFSSSEAVLQKINRIYINQHLDRYDIAINLFDSRGDPDPQNDSFFRYHDFESQYAQDTFETDNQNLYFINEITADLLNRYLGFVEIKQGEVLVGYVIIDLKLKRVIPNTVYPELLVYNVQRESGHSGYSYAIYLGDTLINNSGNFNYAKEFNAGSWTDPSLFTKGVDVAGYSHLGVKGPAGRTAVISSAIYPVRNVLANFSLLFITFIFSLILFILGYVFLWRKRPVKLNYATRIQLYLNLAFFLPLLIVSVTTLSLISSSSKKEVIKQYFEKADGIRNNIVNPLDNYLQGRLGDELMAQDITRIAQYSESDINLFDIGGRLISTSQPKIYDYNILSEFINPQALGEIVEEQNNSVLLNESVGTLGYKSAYVGIRSFGTGDLLGILSIPFFESKYELDKEIVVILTNILNVFTFIFIVILIASYFASRVLTVPLNLITQKIKKTTLTGYNEPLEWNSDDEIGLMVGEYNRMLQNLEASKTALARSEKESAWREMAQQVAHEIKNPLTPMKLTLQHLKRTLLAGNDQDKKLAEKPINTLLHQIETLSEIATSFSSFAQMPVPENQRIEISSILRKSVQLHNSSNEYEIQSHIEGGNHFVMGDPQLMGRIFSNLIINGIQSVPDERTPEISIRLASGDNKALIEIKDNGEGIPDSIRDKIFIPNFSTKDTGSGIGLSIAKRGIEHAGGKIWFDSTCDVGTTIFIELPLVD